MTYLTLIVGLMFATVLMVGLGDRIKLPYPVLMVLVAIAIAFIPGFPHLEVPPELILPLFLPPLLYATAMKTSWSVFRIRWRTVLLLAVALVVLTVAVVAGAMWLLVPSIGIPAAIALGAMVSPPDPVAVESVAGRVQLPRRLITVLQSEGLFNDAAAIVIFQAAVGAAVTRHDIDGHLAVEFLLGAAIAVVMGLAMGFLTKTIYKFVDSSVARSAVTLVVPFAVYIGAEHFHASGVIAVVVTALEIRRNSRPQDADERITSKSFWEVVEMLATGVAFGLVGLEIKHVISVEGEDIFRMLIPAGIICALVIFVRVAWLSLLAVVNRKSDGPPPGSVKDVVILSWSGMRGLATLALALALPTTLADGTPFPERDQIIVTACAVLITTLVLPGLTLPWLVKKLDAAESHEVEKEMEDVLAQRGQEAALAAMDESPLLMDLSPKQKDTIKNTMKHLRWDLSTEGELESYKAHKMDAHETMVAAQTIALDAAREEVLNARNEPDMDPEIVDRVLHRLDLRSRLIEN